MSRRRRRWHRCRPWSRRRYRRRFHRRPLTPQTPDQQGRERSPASLLAAGEKEARERSERERREREQQQARQGRFTVFGGGRSGGRQRGYTTLFRRQNRRLQIVTGVAVVAVLVALGVGIAAAAGVFTGSSEKSLDVAALVRKAKPSVVLVNLKVNADIGKALELKNNRTGNGSGWVLDADKGEIVTNGHVVNGGQSIAVALPGGHERDAKLVGVNLCQDVALVKVSDTSGLETIPEVRQSELSEGDQVVALGFPGTLSPQDNLVTTAGVISVVNSKIGDDYPDTVQTDAAINPGNSGGPLLNADGKVVGMNTITDTQTENQAFAIASDHIDRLLPDLRKGIDHGWIGWYIDYLGADPTKSLVRDQSGNEYYGPAVVGPTAGNSSEGLLAGAVGGKEQYVYAIDGHKFGPGANDIPLDAEWMDALCAFAADKKTGDVVKPGSSPTTSRDGLPTTSTSSSSSGRQAQPGASDALPAKRVGYARARPCDIRG